MKIGFLQVLNQFNLIIVSKEQNKENNKNNKVLEVQQCDNSGNDYKFFDDTSVISNTTVYADDGVHTYS